MTPWDILKTSHRSPRIMRCALKRLKKNEPIIEMMKMQDMQQIIDRDRHVPLQESRVSDIVAKKKGVMRCMKVTIDRSNCTSCGTCWDACPAFFEESPEDSFSRVLERYHLNGDHGKGIAPEDLEACVTEAADFCPVSIITVEES